MNFARCLLPTICGFALAANTCVAAELVDYCPPNAKQVFVVDVARFQASPAGKSLLGDRSIVEFVKAEAFRHPPNSEADWNRFPQREAIEHFAGKTSQLMYFDVGGFLSLGIICKGEYDKQRIQKVMEELAASNKKTLEISVKPHYTMFSIGEDSTLLFVDDKTVAYVLGKGRHREAMLKLLDQDEIPPATARCAVIVKKLHGDREVCVAAACEEARRGLFDDGDEEFEKTYDIVERTVASRANELGFKYRKVHVEAKQAKEAVAAAKRKRDEMVEKNPKSAGAEALRKTSIEQVDKQELVEGKVDVGVLKEDLLEILFFSAD